jgi:predicted negative regulator of RcsB-dependent stress response
LEDEATQKDKRHYKAVGAKGRGDALVELGNHDEAIGAYDIARRRIGEAEAQHRDPVFTGAVYLQLAKLQEQEQARDHPSARHNAARALEAFGSTNGLGVASDDLRAATEIKARMDAALNGP